MGFEALSRGASFALFVETAHAARGAIRQNIDALSLFGITRIHRRSATELGEKPAGLGSPFNLAFMDPPYNRGLVAPCLAVLRSGKWLADEALIVIETAEDETLDLASWQLVSERSIGAAKFWFVKAD